MTNGQQQPQLDELIKLAKLKKEKPEEYKELMTGLGEVFTDFSMQMAKAMKILYKNLRDIEEEENKTQPAKTGQTHY